MRMHEDEPHGSWDADAFLDIFRGIEAFDELMEVGKCVVVMSHLSRLSRRLELHGSRVTLARATHVPTCSF